MKNDYHLPKCIKYLSQWFNIILKIEWRKMKKCNIKKIIWSLELWLVISGVIPWNVQRCYNCKIFVEQYRNKEIIKMWCLLFSKRDFWYFYLVDDACIRLNCPHDWIIMWLYMIQNWIIISRCKSLHFKRYASKNEIYYIVFTEAA